MRPLKYKAYIKDYNQIADVEILELLPNGKAQSVIIRDDELNEEVYRVTQGQFELLEFTGQHDNEGDEVYTGYVIKCSEYHTLKCLRGIRAEVIWDNDFLTYGIDTPTREGFISLSETNEYSIIGNIYENKELLNG